MTERVQCLECDNMILPRTAADNAGLCGRCARIPAEYRARIGEYRRRLELGLEFTPSDEEFANRSTPAEVLQGTWRLQSEYYSEMAESTPREVLELCKSKSAGHVFLVTDGGGQLNFGFTESYGVCEYQHPEAGEFRYAYSERNLREQVPEGLHVAQACPCCGVFTAWYPSRYHLPRETGWAIMENAIARKATPGVQWLVTGDITFTTQGRG